MKKVKEPQVLYSSIDQDTILTEEEQIRHEEAMKNLREGNVFTLEDIKLARIQAGLEA